MIYPASVSLIKGFPYHSDYQNIMIFTIAIEPDIKLVERLTFLQEDLGKIITARGADSRWIRPEYMHVPLLCLGNRDDSELPDINQVIRQTAREFATFQLEIAGISAYPSPECPRLIQIDARAGEILNEIRERLMDGFRAVNIGFDGSAFRATLLLGRVATKGDKISLADAIHAIEGLNFGQSEIFELALYSSELKESGPVHQVVSRFFLKNGELSPAK
ncbi:MAG: RNA 2',3'-cyclic phosphodiesterase [Proteobacteria bacterium]|nr:RNA 2',3'-cyclic phosphodiesterase [Pseudomonadota bacterium]